MENYQLFIEQFAPIQDCIKGRKNGLTPLKTGQVRIAMAYSPINPSDLIPVSGAYRHRVTLPSLLGYEGIGRVVEVADSKDANLLGKRVLPLRGEGIWQRFVICLEEHVVEIPDSISDVEATVAYINHLTAWILCKEVFNLKGEDTLLINAGNSFIGSVIAQLSKIIGFHLISIVRKAEQKERLEKLGIKDVLPSDGENIYREVLQLTNGQGVRAAVDSVGGNAGTELARCVSEGGFFRTIGLLSGKQVDWPFISSQFPISAEVFHLRHSLAKVNRTEWLSYFDQLFEWIGSGQLVLSEPSDIFSIEDYKKALVAQAEPDRQGKILFIF
jgi:putative oxidoreductase